MWPYWKLKLQKKTKKKQNTFFLSAVYLHWKKLCRPDALLLITGALLDCTHCSDSRTTFSYKAAFWRTSEPSFLLYYHKTPPPPPPPVFVQVSSGALHHLTVGTMSHDRCKLFSAFFSSKYPVVYCLCRTSVCTLWTHCPTSCTHTCSWRLRLLREYKGLLNVCYWLKMCISKQQYCTGHFIMFLFLNLPEH